MEEKRWFLTVDRCNEGQRGVLCNRAGKAAGSDTEQSQKEMQDMLGPFWLILDPVSMQLTADELAEYKFWRPLAEYSYEFGIASTVDDEEMTDDQES